MHDSMAVSSTPRPVPQVQAGLDSACNLAERLTETSLELQRRLSMVLRPEPEGDLALSAKRQFDGKEGQVPVAATLIDHCSTLYRVEQTIDSILHRLEV